MRRPDANSRFALKLRRLRSRFGITAARVTVRTHVPWHWRALGVVATGAMALALAGWVYDAGRRIAGFDRSESSQEIGTLQQKLLEMEAEVLTLRSASDASESSLQIERTAQQQLTLQVKALEAENNRLKEENAVFERLSQGGGKETAVTISRLHVAADGPGGRYRYQFLVSQNGEQRGREFRGAVQVVVALPGGGPDDDMMTFPASNDPDAGRFAVVFKYFRRIDGTFVLPSKVKPKTIEIRLMQDGIIRASQAVIM